MTPAAADGSPRRPVPPYPPPLPSLPMHRFSSSSLPDDARRSSEDPPRQYRPHSQPQQQSEHPRRRRRRRPSGHDDRDDRDDGGVRSDPVLSSRRALDGAKLGATDLNNVNRLYVLGGCLLGLLVGAVLVQTGLARATVARWLGLPGELFTRAMLAVIVPTVFLNSVLASMHFWTLNKARALGAKLLTYFVVTTLWASVLGTLLVVCCVPLFPTHNLVRSSGGPHPGVATIGLRCPGTGLPLVLTSDGGLRCSRAAQVPGEVNGTMLLLDDFAHSFRLRGDETEDTSIAHVARQVLRGFFPGNLVDAFLHGDVLGVIIAGVLLGVGLIHISGYHTREQSPREILGDPHVPVAPGMIFLLIMQAEVVTSVLLRLLLGVLPVAMIFVVAGSVVSAHVEDTREASLVPSSQDLVTLFGVLLFALLLELSTMLTFTLVVTKTNPLKYLRQLLPAQLVALGTTSSLISLPTTVRSIAATRQVSMPLAHFVCSIGAMLNKNGSAVYLAVASTYVITVAGYRDSALTTGHILVLVLVSALCSLVVPPVARGHMVVIGTILSGVFGIDDAAGNQSRLLVYLTAMDWLCDPIVTVVNVTNDALLALVLATQMDESFIAYGAFEEENLTETQEEDTDDGLNSSSGWASEAAAPGAHRRTSVSGDRPPEDGVAAARGQSTRMSRFSSIAESELDNDRPSRWV